MRDLPERTDYFCINFCPTVLRKSRFTQVSGWKRWQVSKFMHTILSEIVPLKIS